MRLRKIINKIKDYFGLRNSFAALKVVEISNPDLKRDGYIEDYIQSASMSWPDGIRFCWQGGSTKDGQSTIELTFYSDVVTIEQIIDQLRKQGFSAEVISVKIKKRD